MSWDVKGCFLNSTCLILFFFKKGFVCKLSIDDMFLKGLSQLGKLCERRGVGEEGGEEETEGSAY